MLPRKWPAKANNPLRNCAICLIHRLHDDPIALPKALCQFALIIKGQSMGGHALNPVFETLGTTIFTVMSALATRHGAINLGQGFPDEDGPLGIREAAARALREGPNQYPPMQGLSVLRQAVAAHSRQFYGLEFDPETEVLVTSGATEALTDCIMGLTAPGDEAILIEPCMIPIRRCWPRWVPRQEASRCRRPAFASPKTRSRRDFRTAPSSS